MNKYESTYPGRVFSWLIVKEDGSVEKEFVDGKDNEYLKELNRSNKKHDEIKQIGFEGLGHYAYVDRDGEFKTVFDDCIIRDKLFLAWKDPEDKTGILHPLINKDHIKFFELKGFDMDLIGGEVNVNKFKFGYNTIIDIKDIKCHVKVDMEYIVSDNNELTKRFDVSIAPDDPTDDTITICLAKKELFEDNIVEEIEGINLISPITDIDITIN